jgi:hypothetical protein
MRHAGRPGDSGLKLAANDAVAAQQHYHGVGSPGCILPAAAEADIAGVENVLIEQLPALALAGPEANPVIRHSGAAGEADKHRDGGQACGRPSA